MSALKYSLKNQQLYCETKNKIVEAISKIPEYQQLRKNSEAILLAVRIVEDWITKKSKIDKKKLVLEALTALFCLDANEQLTAGQQIDFFHERGMIRKSKISKVVISYLANLFLKKFL